MSKFICAWHNQKEKEHMLKVVLDDKKGETWVYVPEVVFKFAKNNFSEGDVCHFEYNESNGRINVTKILKGDGENKITDGVSKAKENSSEAKYKCEDCGKELKTDKYPKCFDCNKKNPAKKKSYKSSGSSSEFRSPEQITKDYLANSTSMVVKGALVGCQGHLNPNNIKEVTLTLMESVYKKFQELVK